MPGMWQHWITREPSLAFGLPLYLLFALAVPLHLGWIGSSWIVLAIYVAGIAVLFSTVDALRRPRDYPAILSVLPQSALSLVALAVPAALAFAVGTLAGQLDEQADEQVCAAMGAGESDSVFDEANDSFDVAPDCVWE